MSLFKLILRSLVHYRRSNTAVVLGAAVGVAVVTGSLLVGDSVKGSLRHLALERLGRTDLALASSDFFGEALAARIADSPGFRDHFDACVPAIIIEGTAAGSPSDDSDGESPPAVPRTTIIAADGRFAEIGSAARDLRLDGRAAAVNRALADDLGLSVGDSLVVSVPRPGAVPADSLFGRRTREETVRQLRLTVRQILPDSGLGRFSLRSDRVRPRNVFVSLSWLQQQLRRDRLANTLLVTSQAAHPAGHDAAAILAGALARSVAAEDYGLRLVPNESRGYVSLETSRMALPPAVVSAAREAARETGHPLALTSVYLANSLARVGPGASGDAIPYSVVAGLDHRRPPPFGPLVSATSSPLPEALGLDGILLNAWAAEDLGAALGNPIEMVCYHVAPNGALALRPTRFTLLGVVALDGPAADPLLVPAFEGITDLLQMRDWRPPFPIDLSLIRPKDEAYWEKYRTTPKAFISLDAARRLWSPGAVPDDRLAPEYPWITSIRLAARTAPAGEAAAADEFLKALLRRLPPSEMGLAFRPVRADALRAAAGSTDYASLFLGLSSFLVIAAGLLVGLLLRLSVESRARQAGILLATGFTHRRLARTLLLEALVMAVAAALIGAPLGVAYARGIIWALATLWVDALGPFTLRLHVGAASIAVGALAGLAVAMIAAVWAVRLLRRTELLALLAGWRAMAAAPPARRSRTPVVIAAVSLVLAVVVIALALAARLIPATAAFFIGGALALVAGLAATLAALSPRAAPRPAGAAPLSLPRLAGRYAMRNRARSALTTGLLACASFAVVTVAANRSDPSTADVSLKSSGAGGFTLVADSELPVFVDLNAPEGRLALGIADEAESAFRGARVFSLRVRGGDDASCLNVQRPLVPRLVGVPPDMVARGGFAFAGAEAPAGSAPAPADPWQLLDAALPGDAVPVIGDEASLKWILHSGLGRTLIVPGPRGDIPLRVVGLLRGSIWQSELLMSERQFVRHFGSGAGYRKFLIETPPGAERLVARTLRESLGDLGFDVRGTAEVLARYAGVQNAYLSTFQTLGGLGLVLGTFGVVTVLLRGAAERRSELALMLALGFTHRRLVRLVVLENAMLLALGLAIGAVAGLVAVSPHLKQAGAAVAWGPLLLSLAAVLAVGIVACAVAASRAVGRHLLPALRSE